LKKGRIVQRELPKFDPAPSARFAARILTEGNIQGVLIGRLAIWAYLPKESDHEFTKDLDIAVPYEEMCLVRSWLDQNSIRYRELDVGGVNVLYPDSGVNVDFIDRVSRKLGNLGPLYREAVLAAMVEGETTNVEGTALVVVPPEYLVVMKIAAGEPKDERDVVRLLANVVLDIDYIRDVMIRHTPLHICKLERMLREVGHPAALPCS